MSASTLAWESRCPSCAGRFVCERHVTARTTLLPGRGSTEVTRWTISCEHAHEFVLRGVREHVSPPEYQIAIPSA